MGALLNLLALIRQLSGQIDFSKLPAILAAIKNLQALPKPTDTPSAEAEITAALAVAHAVASATTTTADDDAVAFIESLRANPVVEALFVKAVLAWQSKSLAAGETLTLEGNEPFTAEGFDPSKIAQLAQAVLQIIALVRQLFGV